MDLFKVKAVKGEEEERLYYIMCSLTIEEEEEEEEEEEGLFKANAVKEEDKDEDVDLFKVKAVKGEEERLYYRMRSLTIEEERSFKSANLAIKDRSSPGVPAHCRKRERES